MDLYYFVYFANLSVSYDAVGPYIYILYTHVLYSLPQVSWHTENCNIAYNIDVFVLQHGMSGYSLQSW